MKKNKRIFLSIAVITMAFGVGLAFLLGSEPDRQANARSKANTVIAAIKEFQRKNKTAPEHLAQLVPEQLQEVPMSGVKDVPDYAYRRLPSDPSNFELGVFIPGAPTRTVMIYRSNKEYGDCLTSGAKLHSGYKIIEAKPDNGWIVLREQTD